MAKDGVKYDAFISYRHSELDSFVAETLHKQLESFKLPRGVVRNKTLEMRQPEAKCSEVIRQENGDVEQHRPTVLTREVKTRIHRVFRDKEELPLATNLADPITEALQNSEYLIVICSPRLPESMWCRKEIETFIEMHDREHVLAVLAEGEPDTSFPEELLYREAEEKKPDGSILKVKIPVEPLAADVRGTKRGEIRRKIKSELLRLVAPMFDCSYDDLKQRHKERRTRKILVTAMSVSAVCLLFGIISTTMALQIKHQNTQIKMQSEEIVKQSEEIVEQSEEIEKQYQEAKRNTAISRAREATGYLEEGDRMKAVATAQDAILDLAESGVAEADGDYPAETVYALADSLYLYENGQQILPDRILEADTAVRVMKLSPEGSRIATVDASGQIVVWQPDDSNVRIEIHATDYFSDMTNKIAFLGEDCLFVPVDDEVILYNVSQGEAVPAYRIACEDYVGIIVLQEIRQAIVLSRSGYQAVDCNDGSLLYVGQWEEDGMSVSAVSAYAVSEDNRYWALSLASDYASEEERRAVVVYDTDGERLNSYEIAYEYVESLRFDEERLYIISNHSEGFDIGQASLGMESRLQAFDINGAGTPVWTYERQAGWLYETSYAHMEGSNYLLCSGYSDVIALDKRDGSYVDTFAFGVEVVKLGNYSGSDNFIAFTRDGVWHYLNMQNREDMVGTLFPACTSSNVMEFAIGDGYCVTLPYNSRRMTLYRTAKGQGLEEVHQGEHNYIDAVCSTDGRYMAVSYYNDNYTAAVEMFDTDSSEVLWNYEDASFYNAMTFFDYDGQETLALLTDEHIIVLEPEQGTILDQIPLEINGTFHYIDSGAEHRNASKEERQCFFWWDGETIYGYDLSTMDYAYKIQPKEQIGYNDVIAVPDDQTYFAVADKEEGVLRFYDTEDGEVFFTYGEDSASAQEEYLNTGYIETMFFDEGESTRHLYIVYMDGRIMRLDVGVDQQSPQFCSSGSYHVNPEKYNGLGDVMRGYRYTEGDDYAIMHGNIDAYLLERNEGDILAHLHGFLGYDSSDGTVYLTSNRTIYRIPLYTLQQMNEIAADVRKTGQW